MSKTYPVEMEDIMSERDPHPITMELFDGMENPDFDDRRSGADRRETAGRRLNDVDLKVVQDDMKEMRDEIRLISRAIQKIAVQEERVASLVASLVDIKRDIMTLDKQYDRLKEGHDQCQIGELQKDVEWLKWFVMGNSMTLFAVIIGIIVHFVRKGGIQG